MKKIIIALTVIAAALLLPGCLAPTQSTIREYDAAGNVIKETVTSESIVKTVVESTKDKLVYLNDQSWLAGIRAIPPGSSAENPMGTLEILAGRSDKTMLTMPMEKTSDVAAATSGIEAITTAARAGDIMLSATGVSAGTAAASDAAANLR